MVFVHRQLAPLLLGPWQDRKNTAEGRSEGNLLTSWQPGSREYKSKGTRQSLQEHAPETRYFHLGPTSTVPTGGGPAFVIQLPVESHSEQLYWGSSPQNEPVGDS